MAQFKFEAPKDLMKSMKELETKSPELCREMVDAGLDVAYKAVANKVPVKTGTLKKSLKKTKVKINKSGEYFGSLKFNGYDKKRTSKKYPKGVPNSLRAAVYEYGNTKQTARPFLRPALTSAENDIKAAMQKVYDEEVKKFDN